MELIIFLVVVWLPLYIWHHYYSKNMMVYEHVKTIDKKAAADKMRLTQEMMEKRIKYKAVDIARKDLKIIAVTHTVKKKRTLPKRKHIQIIDNQDKATIKAILGKITMTHFELESLKRLAVARGIDDIWGNLDSTLTYEENRKNLENQFGTSWTDREYEDRYNKYAEMEQ